MKTYELYRTDGVNTDSIKTSADMTELLQFAANELKDREVSGLGIDEEDEAEQFQLFVERIYGEETPEEIWRSLAYYGTYGR